MIELSLSLGHDPLWAHRLPPESLRVMYAHSEVKRRRKARVDRARIQAGAKQ